MIHDLRKRGEESKILLVEVNPFDGFYGTLSGSTGLFSWQADRLLLTGTRRKLRGGVYAPFELRLREEILSEAEVKRRTRPEWWALMNC